MIHSMHTKQNGIANFYYLLIMYSFGSYVIILGDILRQYNYKLKTMLSESNTYFMGTHYTIKPVSR